MFSPAKNAIPLLYLQVKSCGMLKQRTHRLSADSAMHNSSRLTFWGSGGRRNSRGGYVPHLPHFTRAADALAFSLCLIIP